MFYKVLIWFLTLFGNKAADKYVDHLFKFQKLYIDRCLISKTDASIIFDITVSSTFDKPISITHFTGGIYQQKKVGIHGNGVQRVSATYKIYRKEEGIIIEVDSSKFSDQAQAWNNGRRIILDCDLLQTIDANSIDRFTIEWFLDTPTDSYELIDTSLTFSKDSKKIRTQPFVQTNPYFNNNQGVTLISMR